MRIRRIAISAVFAAGLATLPVSTAKAQYYPPPCSPFPLSWPFCVVGAVVGTAAMIVTAPVWAITGAPPYYYGYYWPPCRRAIQHHDITRPSIITRHAEPCLAPVFLLSYAPCRVRCATNRLIT